MSSAKKKIQRKTSVTRKSTSLLFKSFYEYVRAEDIQSLPRAIRGIYALYQQDENGKLNLAYVGMTSSGAKGRLGKHAESKFGRWSHCSVLEVWDNVTREQIQELEALFRHTLRRDANASSLNVQKGSVVFHRLKRETEARNAA